MKTRLILGSKEGVAGAADACTIEGDPPGTIGAVPGTALTPVIGSSSTSCSSSAGVAVGAGTPGESRLTNGPVGVARMMPAYRPLSLTISRDDDIRSGGRPSVLSTLPPMVSFGNFARR